MSAGRLILPPAEPVTSAGSPVVGATLTIYLTGTTTLADIYADEGLTTAISNPQTSNAAGLFYSQSNSLWMNDSVGYDVVLNLEDGTSYTYVNLFVLGSTGASGEYMPLTGGTFTGPVYGLTPAANDDSTLLATTAYVVTALETFAPLFSPGFTGTPTAPTATDGTDTDQIATCAFVLANQAASGVYAQANCTISGGTLTTNTNSGFASITRSSTGAFNFTFSEALASAFYTLFVSVQNTTQLQIVIPESNKTASGFSLSCLTDNNDSQDPSGFNVVVLAIPS